MPLRPRAGLGLLVVIVAVAGCQCGDPPPPPPPAIGDGDPIGPPDAGDVFEIDAGPVVCQEDDNEDNDAREQAHAVTGGEVTGESCGDDDDWYSVTAQPGCDVDARMTQGAGTGDIDMLMFDPEGQLVGSSSGSGSEEAIHITAAADGDYAVRLRSGSRDAVPYTLSLTALCTSDFVCPDDDPLEDNDNAAQSTPLAEGVTSAGIVCGLDEDWFLSPVTLGCIADARVDFTHAQGDIDFELYAGDGVTRVASSAGTQNEERLKKVITEGGMAYRVFFFNADDQKANTYRVVVNEICAGQLACPSDDPFEPNDDRATATTLFAPKDEAIGVICGDDDFYDLLPQAGCTVHATLTTVFAQGDLDLELQNGSDGTQIAISQTTTDTESIDYTAPDSARVALRVLGFNGATNGYRLHVEQQCP